MTVMDIMVTIMRRYPKLGRVYRKEGVIYYGKGKVLTEESAQKIVGELYGD